MRNPFSSTEVTVRSACATSWLAPLGGLLGAAILWFSPVRHLIVLPAPVGGGPPATVDRFAIAVATEMDQPPGA